MYLLMWIYIYRCLNMYKYGYLSVQICKYFCLFSIIYLFFENYKRTVLQLLKRGLLLKYPQQIYNTGKKSKRHWHKRNSRNCRFLLFLYFFDYIYYLSVFCSKLEYSLFCQIFVFFLFNLYSQSFFCLILFILIRTSF